ncbi:ABC transporter permease [Ancylobacter mangrovi]|uniref:ABC transporter permease n=1 Tax=Ancylobacter mangrovi TaxID=2972472 RepID=A0A9X2PN56_9HYPH|nr:ABC transporter permease [Ancylobacter mangrovi]MCS0496843.1 ABC transporter permease [Ancylobacter mangrovi]MCS0504810.1 ABC transporter permease [Ancylobacter mangrovi]
MPKADAANAEAARPMRSLLAGANPKLVVGALVLALLVAVAIAAPWIAPYRFDEMSILSRLKPPSLAHWCGTDEFGRDVFSRTLMGARLSLMMGFAATAVSLLIGVPLGLWAGYRRGTVDEAIMRATDVLLSFPPIMLGLLILAVTPPSLWKMIIAVGIVYVPSTVRLTRSVTLDLAGEEFVQAARARGERAAYILHAEILPNAWPPIMVEASLRVTFAILLGAALSFIGLGAQPPSSDWGLMISEARPLIDRAPWVALAPGIAMGITVIAVNLLGDGLREALDPRMQRKGG